jgi:hypothetical protein
MIMSSGTQTRQPPTPLKILGYSDSFSNTIPDQGRYQECVGCNQIVTFSEELIGLPRMGRVVWKYVNHFFVLVDSEILLAASVKEDQPDLISEWR